MDMIGTFPEIIAAAKKRTSRKRVVLPSPDRQQIDIMGKAVAINLIFPVLIGDGKKIEGLVKAVPLLSGDHEIIDERDQSRSLSRAIGMIKENQADILMQGDIEPQTFVHAVLDTKNGLLSSKLASFVSVFQLLKRNKLILVTDTYINNTPSLPDKQMILENALRLAGILEIASPRVAVLAAIEQVNPGIPSTLDAAILAKMGERKQFGDVMVEGPLDIDCALNQKAAARKGVNSIVTGNVDIYLTPEIDTGYALAQLLVFIGRMQMAGVLMGTARPVILDLPFVSVENKIVEIALAVLMAEREDSHE
jgi:phosphate butyryltransferase